VKDNGNLIDFFAARQVFMEKAIAKAEQESSSYKKSQGTLEEMHERLPGNATEIVVRPGPTSAPIVEIPVKSEFSPEALKDMSGLADVFVRARIYWKEKEFEVPLMVHRAEQVGGTLKLWTEVLHPENVEVLFEALIYYGMRDPKMFLADIKEPLLWRVVVCFEDKAIWVYDHINQKPLFEKGAAKG